ncbi:MAG TPA: DUF3551 domain-containing protein [Bradyrhizobium sp.]|nr:DUF3551 domain-containing protein [Bradyrhizobium sp.]
MRLVILCGALLAAMLIEARLEAKAGSWCSFYDASTYNCGFNSYAQCMANISGVGGLCSPNYFERSAYAPLRYYPKKRHYR